MTVINPSSISGITSITMPSGDGNVLTIHTNDGTERFRIDSSGNVKVGSACTISPDGDGFFTGVTTATTFTGAHSGSGANLTSLPAAQLTGTLPAISGANLTGIAATDNVRTGILDVAGIATFRNDVNIGAAVTISESGIEASGIGITCANINGTQIGGRRNMIINGDMNIAQRGTPTSAASYTSGGYAACDRWRLRAISTDQAAFVISQESDAPTASGFTKSIKIKTNTVESALASDEIFHVSQRIEAQDLQHLKNGTSSALPVTLSFWVKAYQTGTYAINVYKPDSPNRQITATYTISASNTWEFKTMTFPGDTSGGGIANDNGTGFQIYWLLATGTDYTGTTSTSWDNYANGGFANGQAVNIMSSTDNYFYLTGVQFEVGSQATAFEHRSFGEELRLCQRYYQVGSSIGAGYGSANGYARAGSVYATQMRATPTLATTNSGSGSIIASGTSNTGFYVTYGSLGGSSAGIFSFIADAEL